MPVTNPPAETAGPVGENVYVFEALKLLIVLVPGKAHDGATPVIVGIAGVTNIIKLVNEAEATEVQIPKPAVTV